MAGWLRWLAVLSVLGFPIAVICVRLGVIEFKQAMMIMMATLVIALAVFFIGMFLTFSWRESNPESAKIVRMAAYLALLPLLGLGSQVLTAKKVPMIHNISTDTQNPPQFDKIASIRTDKHNPWQYDAEKLAQVQQEAYPEVKTLLVDLSLEEAYSKAQALVTKLGWVIENQQLEQDMGIIEATETTKLWAFKDDIVIRVTSTDNGQTAVDLHSVSRIGRSDLGANAKRIERFLKSYSQ